jgi:two-component system, LytTR family, sensor kinase
MDANAIRQSRIVMLALAVGLFFTTQFLAMSVSSGRPVQFVNDFLPELLYWSTWAVLSPLMLVMVRRWSFDAKPFIRPVTAHIVGSAILAPVQTVAAFTLDWLTMRSLGASMSGDLVTWLLQRSTTLVWGISTGIFYYWLVVGLYAAMRFRRLYAAEQLSAAEFAARSAGLQAELTRAQLEGLRSQLRPHFLFNTLNAISVLTTEDPGKAQSMLLRLSVLLRRNLDEEQHEVPLHQELMFLNDYLDIQRERFGDRLMIDVAVDESVSDVRVPVLLLQPLVENAIEHGASEQSGATYIRIRATKSHGMLRLTVEDNGPGVGDAAAVREGIGLGNTRERLRRLYGDRATLRLGAMTGGDDVDRSVAGTGTRVDILVPLSAAAQ